MSYSLWEQIFRCANIFNSFLHRLQKILFLIKNDTALSFRLVNAHAILCTMMSQTSVNLLSRIAQVSRFIRSLFSSSPSGQGNSDPWVSMNGRETGRVSSWKLHKRDSLHLFFVYVCVSLEILSCSILFSFFFLVSTIQHGWCNCKKNSFIEIERGREN